MNKKSGKEKAVLAGMILFMTFICAVPAEAAKSPEVTETELERQSEGTETTEEAEGPAAVPAQSSQEENNEDAANLEFSEEELSDGTIQYGELEELVKRGNASVKTAVGDYDTNLEIYQEALESLAAAKREMTQQADELEDEGASQALIAQYEANAEQLGASVAQMNQTIRKVTGAGGTKSLNQSVNTVVKSAQTLMSSYNKIRGQREAAEKEEERAKADYEKTKNMEASGLATAQELLLAEQNFNSASLSLQSLRDSEYSLKSQLAVMIGRNAGEIEIGTIPEPDPSVIDSFDLEQDKKTAITTDSSIQSLRKSQAGGSAEKKLRSQQIEEAKGEKNSTMDTLYSDMIAKRQSYEAAEQAFQSAEKEYGALQTKYQAGLISRQDYLQGEVSWLQQKAAREAAAIELSQAIEAYRWEIKGV